jgi:hypothetical protein
MSFDGETTRYATNGKGNAGLTLGIIGTSLAGLLATGGMGGGNGGGGLLGGLFGNGGCQNRVAQLESRIAELESMRYTDYVGMDLYKNVIATAKEEDAKIAAVANSLTEAVIAFNRDIALNKQASDYQFALMNQKIDYEKEIADNKLACCCEKVNAKIDCSNQLNALADSSILSYVNATFIPGTLKLPITSICPQPTTAG